MFYEFYYIHNYDVGGWLMSDNNTQQNGSNNDNQKNNQSNDQQRPVPQIKQQYGKDLSKMEKRDNK